MLKWSVSSVSTVFQECAQVDVDNTDLSEGDKLTEEEDEDLEVKATKSNCEGAVSEKSGTVKEENGEGNTEACHLPPFRGRNYLVSGSSHLAGRGIHHLVNWQLTNSQQAGYWQIDLIRSPCFLRDETLTSTT